MTNSCFSAVLTSTRVLIVTAAFAGFGLRSELLKADVFEISASDAGFINELGRTSKNDGKDAPEATFNYSAGAIDDPPLGAAVDVPRSNYFTFDLSGITSEITSAELSLFNPIDGYGSPDASETYELFGAFADPPPSPAMVDLAVDLTGFYSVMEPDELAAAASLFAEITGGPGSLGSVTMSAADDGTMIDIAFSSLGIDYLNTFKGGPVVFGGMLTTLDMVDAGDEFVFGFSAPLITGVVTPDPAISPPTPTPKLTITSVPEPSGIAFLAALGIGFVGKHRREHLR